jgi:hypothetical protein
VDPATFFDLFTFAAENVTFSANLRRIFVEE